LSLLGVKSLGYVNRGVYVVGAEARSVPSRLGWEVLDQGQAYPIELRSPVVLGWASNVKVW
jgi:hypothetical protein